MDEFQTALKLKPKWADAHYGLGASLCDLQEWDSALKELRIAIELAPTNATGYYYLGVTWERKGDADRRWRTTTKHCN